MTLASRRRCGRMSTTSWPKLFSPPVAMSRRSGSTRPSGSAPLSARSSEGAHASTLILADCTHSTASATPCTRGSRMQAVAPLNTAAHIVIRPAAKEIGKTMATRSVDVIRRASRWLYPPASTVRWV